MNRRLVLLCLGVATLAGAADFRLQDDRGHFLSLADYKNKVVVLNFWATWCHGCVQEIPWLMEYQKKYQRQGLVVIGVSMDGDGWKSVRPYLKSRRLNYRVVIGNEEIGRQFGLGNMPMTLLYGRDGRQAAKHEGMIDREACEREIRRLLDAR